MEPTFDPSTVAAFQMTGQDIPWLLRHWAEQKPHHPFMIWEPRAGAGRPGPYRQFLDDASAIGAGLAERGVVQGDKVLIHSENSPEMVLAWYACALVGATGVTTNTRSAG